MGTAPDIPELGRDEVVDRRYVIAAALGHGGTATVYRARDLALHRDVALKVLSFTSVAGRRRFRRELGWLVSHAHPNLARLYDFGRCRHRDFDLDYSAAELIEGGTLETHARGRRWRDVFGPVCDALTALAWLHRAGLRHGDLKPDNVLVRSSGRGVLIDLSASAPLSRISSRDHVSGTPRFMAPELLAGRAAGARADLFSFGKTLQALEPALSEPIPSGCLRLIDRLLRAEPAQRPSDALEVLAILEASAPSGRRPRASVEEPVEPGALLGRDTSLARWQSVLADALSDGPGGRGLLLCGPPGSGKTRLLRELCWQAQDRMPITEGAAVGTTPIHNLVARALGQRTSPTGLGEVLEAFERLCAQGPAVLAMDDVDQLTDVHATLLEALVRSTSPAHRVRWLLSTTEARPSFELERVEVGPLPRDAVASWVERFVPDADVDHIIEVTRGLPGRIREVCAASQRGDLAAGALEESNGPSSVQSAMPSPSGRTLVTRIEALDAEAARALAMLGVAHDALPGPLLVMSGVTLQTMAELESARLAVVAEGAWKAGPTVSAHQLQRELPQGLLEEGACALAMGARAGAEAPDTTARERSEAGALLVRALVASGDLSAATLTLDAAERDVEWAPRAWRSAAMHLVSDDLGPSPAARVAAAAALEAAGELRSALSQLAMALRDRPPPSVLPNLRLRAASCYERLGDMGRAARQLNRARGLATGTPSSAYALLDCRIRTRRGDYAGAAEAAEAALSTEHDEEIAADLHEALGLAGTYLGDTSARDHLERAVAHRDRGGTPRAQLRAHSYLALQAYREGETERASRGFERALEIAESAGLGDSLATAALNFGTACHQLGEWGRALEAYERGLRAAIAWGRERTQTTLRFNLAKLYSDIGCLDRAEALLPEVESQAERAQSAELIAAKHALEAEILLTRGDLSRADESLVRTRAELPVAGSRRERCECELTAAEVALARDSAEDAARALTAASELHEGLQAADVSMRYHVVAGRVALLEDQVTRAQTHCREARRDSARTEQLALRAELDDLTADAYARTGAPTLATRHRTLATEAWERIASSLPEALRDPFWKHPKRVRRQPPMAPASDAAASLPRAALTRRLLEINQRLSSTLDTDAVLRLAMDSAIELTGAERGFVILRAHPRGHPGESMGPTLEVPVARNVDREQIGRSHLKFSHGIASRVVEDAQEMDLLSAFADQVAMALYNGRLLEELRRRTRELEEQKRKVEKLSRTQAHEIERLSVELAKERTSPREGGQRFERIVGQGPAMQKVFDILSRVAPSEVTVLLEGESGTGKELVARTIHESSRRAGPFVAINCAALPEPLLESELFGHKKGAFTGATADRPGLFVSARRGTLFLDELGEAPLGIQAKLLRALQEREVRPLGSERSIPVRDVRIICATNRRLQEEVQAGRFREDLYYRVSVVEVVLPPLRERPEDIPVLAQVLLKRLGQASGQPCKGLSRTAMRKLVSFAFPGNVRQLENVLSRANLMAEGERIEGADLELPVPAALPARGRTREAYGEAEAERLVAALAQHRWNVSEVARALGMPRTTMYRKLKRYGLLRSRS